MNVFTNMLATPFRNLVRVLQADFEWFENNDTLDSD